MMSTKRLFARQNHARMRHVCALLAAIPLLLSGCAKTPAAEEPKEYEYTLREVRYSEERAQYSFRMDMETTETEYASYFFAPTVEQAERSACIQATDQILSALQESGAVPEFYVFTAERYDSVWISEHKLYQTARAWQSADYAADVLMTVYGGFSHYGLAYGYGAFLRGEQSQAELNLTDLEDSDALDLSLLCFDVAFVSEEECAAAQAVACDFVKTYIAEQGEAPLRELLSQSDTADGTENVCKALELYYQGRGLHYTPSAVRYGYGGISFDYTVLSEYGTFYLGKDWNDYNAADNPLVYENFLHERYADTKHFYETNLKQMAQYRELFSVGDDQDDLSIIFLHSRSLPQTSFYQSGTHRIYVQNVDSLMHEYIHALTQPRTSMSNWETEGFARYFSYRYDEYGIAFLNQDYNNVSDSAATSYVREYLSNIGRDIDMAVDYGELENIAVWSRSYTDPNASYVAGSSFVQYLVGEFGEQAVIDAIYGSGTPLPRTYNELVGEWNAYIENTYQSYGKY